MAITDVFKEINHDETECNGSLEVSLGFTAGPDISSNYADIVLILDRYRSMSGSPLSDLKEGSKSFIDIIYQNTGGTNGEIDGGTRIGIVSFADNATANVELSTQNHSNGI